MKILYLTNIPSPYRVDFFEELGKLCDLTVLYERSIADDRERGWMKNRSLNFKSIYLSGVSVHSDSALCVSVIKYLKDKSYDAIIVGGYSTPTGMLAIQYLNMIKRPFILNGDGGFIKADSPLKYKIKKYFIGSAKAWLSSGVTTTEYMVKYRANIKYIHEYPFTSLTKKEILNELIDCNKKRVLKEKLGIKENKVIISVGRYIKLKGFDTLINSMKFIPKDYGVYIIGGKPTEEYLDLKEKLNLENLYFVDFKSKEELEEYYMVADLFVFPTRNDIWGLVINEAMAKGLPIITTEMCGAGVELIINDINGYIIPIDNHKLLGNKINIVLNNDKLRNEMSSNNLKKIKFYTIEEMAKSHFKFLKEFLKC